MEKVDNMQDQMGKVSRDIKPLRKNQKERVEIKNTLYRNHECLGWAHH